MSISRQRDFLSRIFRQRRIELRSIEFFLSRWKQRSFYFNVRIVAYAFSRVVRKHRLERIVKFDRPRCFEDR